MTDTLVNFEAAPLSGALTTLYTSPAGQLGTILTSLNFCNTTGLVQTIRVTMASGGAQDVPAHTMYNYLQIQPGDTFERTAPISLMPGDQVRVVASASGAIACQGYGIALS